MRGALVFDVQRYSLHDGPGIRTTVFLNGVSVGVLVVREPRIH